MYSESAAPGPIFGSRYTVTATTLSGAERELLPGGGQSLSRNLPRYGLSQRRYQTQILRGMIEGRTEVARWLAHNVNRNAKDPVVRIDVHVEGYRLLDGQVELVTDFTRRHDVGVDSRGQ